MKLIVKFFIGAFLFYSCESPEDHRWSGVVFGTTYQITYVGASPEELKLEEALDSIFLDLNNSMSTYLPESTISQFNSGKDSLWIDEHFRKVFRLADSVWQQSSGAFDPTVGTLVNAYGFGPNNTILQLSPKTLDSLKSFVGWDKVYLSPTGWLQKSHPQLYLDFNAIAKGYAVDVVADWLEAQEISDYLIEIGGEIRAKGKSPKTQKPWRVAIDDPKQKKYRAFIQTLSMTSGALATSGNYRKFRVDSVSGGYYVHTIDPRTARPAISQILSVSVQAPRCSVADAWATALMVLSLEEGQKRVEADANLEALWIIAEGDELQQVHSSGWK